MSGKCIFGGRKGLAAALLVAAMSLPLIFGCSSGGDDGPRTFAVRFDANAPQGAQATGAMAALTVAEGQTLVIPANTFSVDGYSFKGWADAPSAAEVKYADGGKITVYADTTLYAVWQIENQGGEEPPIQGGEEEPKTFAVRFDANAPQGTQATGAMATQTVEEGQTLALPANTFSIDGYLFNGWAETSSAAEVKYADKQEITVSADITLYAVWAKEVKTLLKEIVGKAEYEAMSSKVAEGNMTLTAETIKAVGDFFPALENDAANGKSASSMDTETKAAVLQYKEAFVAQAEGETEILFRQVYPGIWIEEPPFDYESDYGLPKKYVVTYKKDFKFDGDFNLDEIEFVKKDGAQGDFNDATLTNNGTSIAVGKLNEIRGDSFPTLIFNKTDNNVVVLEEDVTNGRDAFYLYSKYTPCLEKLEIRGDLSSVIINGQDY